MADHQIRSEAGHVPATCIHNTTMHTYNNYSTIIFVSYDCYGGRQTIIADKLVGPDEELEAEIQQADKQTN